MLQLLLTEVTRHAHYISDTIKIRLEYGRLMKHVHGEEKVESAATGFPHKRTEEAYFGP